MTIQLDGFITRPFHADHRRARVFAFTLTDTGTHLRLDWHDGDTPRTRTWGYHQLSDLIAGLDTKVAG